MQVNPSYGYKIKHAESAALANQIEAFLANGGKINKVKSVYRGTEVLRSTRANGVTFLNRAQRQKKQQKFLKNFSSQIGYGSWAMLAKESGFSSSFIGRVASGENIVPSQENWEKIETAAFKILEQKNESK